LGNITYCLQWLNSPLQISLANNTLPCKVNGMETNSAEEHLQTIRTLMERSAVYRRALAPIMVWNGIVGLTAGILGWKFNFHWDRDFVLFWTGAALLAIIGSFLLVRRQALRDSEPFWSPPTRRVAQALLPPVFIGGFINGILIFNRGEATGSQIFLLIFWTWFYGCALQAAGFFMTRGIKLFGWAFVMLGCGFAIALTLNPETLEKASVSLLMGLIFGGLHFAYGVYLYLTENRKNAA
jgi:hypothetical protein